MINNAEQVFKNITHGVYVISVKAAGKSNAFTASWVMQVSFDPLLLCFSINPENYSYQLLQQTGKCCISVLSKRQLGVAEHFGRPSIGDKMAGHLWLETSGGVPALADCLAYFDCQVSHYSEAGDHKIAVCQVSDAVLLNTGDPMVYSDTEDFVFISELYNS